MRPALKSCCLILISLRSIKNLAHDFKCPFLDIEISNYLCYHPRSRWQNLIHLQIPNQPNLHVVDSPLGYMHQQTQGKPLGQFKKPLKPLIKFSSNLGKTASNSGSFIGTSSFRLHEVWLVRSDLGLGASIVESSSFSLLIFSYKSNEHK